MVHPLDKPVDSLTEGDIQYLLQLQPSEARRLDYKKCLPGKGDGARKEFFADVSSFANARGGHIFYGIDEEGGKPIAANGVPVSDIDAEVGSLDNSLRDGIKPRIHGLEIKDIPLKNGNYVIVIRIPRSWYGPHMVTFSQSNKFHTRGSNGKYLMDIEEIRRAFVSGDVSTRLKQFREERVSLVLDGHIPVPMGTSSNTVVHLVPLSALTEPTSVDVARVYKERGGPPMIGTTPSQTRFNVDGLVGYAGMGSISGMSGPTHVTQLFRNGTIEGVEGQSFLSSHQPRIIQQGSIERRLLPFVAHALGLLEKEGVAPPFALLVSLLRVKDFWLGRADYAEGAAIDRDVLLLPSVVFDHIPRSWAELAEVMSPIFEALWNACGYASWACQATLLQFLEMQPYPDWSQ